MKIGVPIAGPAETALKAPLASARQTAYRPLRPFSGQVVFFAPAKGGTQSLDGVLTAKAKALDQFLVAPFVLALEVIQQAPPLADHHQQTTAGMEILFVGLEVVGEALDTLREQRHLDFRRTGVTLAGGEFLDQRLLALGRKRHRSVPFLLQVQHAHRAYIASLETYERHRH